jgi:uncharacterized surface protein with fasciclin (FAS1) repeats
MIRPTLLLAAATALAACQPSGEQANQAGTEPRAGSSAGGDASGGEANRTLAEGLGPNHARLGELIERAGLTETLRGAGPYTLFAPTDAAIDGLPEEQRTALASPEQRERLGTVLTYHIVPGTVTAEDIGRAIDQAGGRAEMATVGGANLSVARDGDAIVLSGGGDSRARIVAADGIRSNGVIHGIDGVLMTE